MMRTRQLALVIVQALAEADPARLAHLVESQAVVKFLSDRVAAFRLQFARMMANQPRQAELTVIEALMPMLEEFPTAKQRPTLTPEQWNQVEAALDQYEEANPASNSRAVVNAAISDLQAA